MPRSLSTPQLHIYLMTTDIMTTEPALIYYLYDHKYILILLYHIQECQLLVLETAPDNSLQQISVQGLKDKDQETS